MHALQATILVLFIIVLKMTSIFSEEELIYIANCPNTNTYCSSVKTTIK